MPDRPKRRKNKNKRKNKNNRPDLSKTGDDVNNSINDEPCSATSTSVDFVNKLEVLNSVSESVIAVNPTENQHFEIQSSDNICTNSSIFNQDLNNNATQILREPLSHTTRNSEEIATENAELYVVESPEQSIKSKSKLGNTIKSKSLDNDDSLKITEISSDSNIAEDYSLAIIDSSNVLVSDAESDIEWEKTDDFEEGDEPTLRELASGTLSITSIPLNIAHCDQTQSLTPEDEKSLRHYLQTLDLSTHPTDIKSVEIKAEIEQIINWEIRHRLRKKGLAEDFICPRLGPPRVLDVIDEEGSSESSLTSRRQSHLSDRKSDNEDLEDDVFEDKNKIVEKYSTKAINRRNFGRQIPQQCLLVGAKLKEPEVSEACGDWSIKTVEKMTGAEVVYLTDSSSSTSSIHEHGDETDDGEDTDVSVRIITPTIEVTDTDRLLKNNFSPKIENTLERNKLILNPNETIEHNRNSTTQKSHVVDKTINEENYLKNTSDDNLHEIVILSTDDIKTNLYVKDLEDSHNKCDQNYSFKNEHESNVNLSDNMNATSAIIEKAQSDDNKYDVEMKIIKSELNHAINNLIKEVAVDSESFDENCKENTFSRRDSSSSVGSSQCTAKYNPTHSSLTDVANILHDEAQENKQNTDNTNIDVTSHVKDVFECVTGPSTNNNNRSDKLPLALRDLCVRKIAKFPFGEKILEELASVAERLQNITINSSKADTTSKVAEMPYYPLPDLSSIETVSLQAEHKDYTPPPVKPRNSSLKKYQDDNHWTGVATKDEPVYVCLSPSQKMLMEKTNTVISKEDASQLVDMHKKYVDRRGYKEYYAKDKKHEENRFNSTPIIPFKSQTGSRLLALIQDPKVTHNINKAVSKKNSRDVEQIEKPFMTRNTMSKSTIRTSEQFSTIRDYPDKFKPIPPPRPRKYSSSLYESDESSDLTDTSFRSMKSEKKLFHYSTGNLNKEIENEVSSIQNMHRHCMNFRDEIGTSPRRPSLPKDLCDQQMEYIRRKEKEIESEIKRLESEKNIIAAQKKGPRAPLILEKEIVNEKFVDNFNSFTSHKKDFSINTQPAGKTDHGKLSSLFSSSQEEILRDKMYTEYINQMAERHERKQQKVIKITNAPVSNQSTSKSMSSLDALDSKVNNRIEKEFISKARERWDKLGIKDPETEDEKEPSKNVYREPKPKVIEHKIKVIEGGTEKDVQKLPNHLQDFVRFTAKDKDQATSSIGESEAKPASPHVMILCAVIILVLAVSKYFLRMLRNK